MTESPSATVVDDPGFPPVGGVVAMRSLTLHASSKSIDGQPRPVLHVEYAATHDSATD